MDLVDDEAGDPRRLREAPPGHPDAVPRGRSSLSLRGGLARRHERDPRGDDSRPRVGRRRRLARPRADANARVDRQARARDSGVRPRAIPLDPRDVPAALPGALVRGRRDPDLRGPYARRRDRRQGLRPGRDDREGRAQGAVRARAFAVRPDLAPARREPALRILCATHSAGCAVAVREQEGDHLSAHVLALPLRATWSRS